MTDALLERRSIVLRFFPVPRYLSLGAMACSIEDDIMRFVELSPLGKNMIVSRSGEKKLPTPFENDADEIPAEVKKSVAEFVSQEKVRSVSVVLPERFAYDFFVTIPLVEPAFIRGAISFKLEEHIPIAPAEVIFEYDVIKRDEKSKTLTIAVRAVPEKQIKKYVEFFSSLGVLVSRCETEGKAMLSSALLPSDNVCRIAIKIGKTGAVILVAQGRSPLFSSSVSFGGEEITGVDEKSLSLLNSIKNEAKKVVDYWNSRQDADNTKSAESVILFGSGATYSGVKEFFETALPHPVVLGNVWQNAFSFDEIIPDIPLEKAQDMASVIGLSLSQ